MAALVSYGSSDEEDNLHEAPRVDVSSISLPFREQADSTVLGREAYFFTTLSNEWRQAR